MHEISLVRTIFRTLEEQFSPAELATMEAVELKVGPLANVDPILLQNAYQAVLTEEYPAYSRAQLRVNEIPIVIQCAACGQTSEVRQYRFVCAHCGQPSAHILQGNELLIERVHFAHN